MADASVNEDGEIDPARRIFVPIEKRTERGTWVFRTHDTQVYARLEDGSIRRATPKVNSRDAKRARRRARHEVTSMAENKKDKSAAPENPGQVKVHDYHRTNASGGYETAQFPQSSHQAAKAAGWKRIGGDDEKRTGDDAEDGADAGAGGTDAGGGTGTGGTGTGGGEA